ncbi:MAG: ABC transporter substrate-binding protein [Thermoleophilaceae bacterium]|nr:ABC transporter substrate-binding protein [Thermoleophilaceae bacterium]
MRGERRPPRRPATRAWIVAAVLAIPALALISGCGAEDESRPKQVAAVIGLDFTPNAVHAPVYAAIREGHDRKHGVKLRIRPPGSAPDSLKLLTSGKADLAVLDIHDLGLARERGADVVGVAALVQRPLAAIIAQPDIRRPRDLEGRRVGVSGLPSDPALLRAVVEDDGGDYAKVRQTTIGFAAVPSLIEKKIDAVPAFWNAEGVALRQRGVPTREFRVDDFGAPRYPEVVLFATRATVERRREMVKSVLQALKDGTESVLGDPEPAIREIARAGGADEKLVRAQLRAVSPALRPPLKLDPVALERWADFDARYGILERRPDVRRAFVFDLLD